jgi:hypothetical protein
MIVHPEETKSSLLRYIDLEKQIWRDIYTFIDIRILKENLKINAKTKGDRITDDYAEKKAKDIQYCVRQAKDYFQSSKTASLVTKPTLIYYGLISLVASLIIYKDRDKTLNSMCESHGLKDKYPDSIKQVSKGNVSKDKILEISAEIQDSGTFPELSQMDLFERFRLIIKKEGQVDSSKDFKQCLNFKSTYPNIKEINLLALLQNIPEIWKETKLSLKKEQCVFIGEAITTTNGVTVRFSKELCTVNELKSKFTFIERSQYGESNDYYFFSLSKDLYQQHTPLTKNDIIGTQFLTANQNNSFITNDLILYYLTFFLLGSLSRYKPALWRVILEDSLHGLNTIPEILCESSYIKIPLSILSEFNNNYYKI